MKYNNFCKLFLKSYRQKNHMDGLLKSLENMIDKKLDYSKLDDLQLSPTQFNTSVNNIRQINRPKILGLIKNRIVNFNRANTQLIKYHNIVNDIFKKSNEVYDNYKLFLQIENLAKTNKDEFNIDEFIYDNKETFDNSLFTTIILNDVILKLFDKKNKFVELPTLNDNSHFKDLFLNVSIEDYVYYTIGINNVSSYYQTNIINVMNEELININTLYNAFVDKNLNSSFYFAFKKNLLSNISILLRLFYLF